MITFNNNPLWLSQPIQLLSKPSVNLLIHNNQLKRYNNNTFYLKDKTEFSLMFTNSNQCKIACELIFNGKIQANRLVLLPNSTVKLDRYLDDNKKFVFDVYQVDNNEVVKTIIKDNGTLRIRFFAENAPIVTQQIWNSTTVNSNYCANTAIPRGSSNDIVNEFNVQCSGESCDSNFLSVDQPRGTVNYSGKVKVKSASSQIETGRIAAGMESNQSFNTDYSTYNTFSFGFIDFNLLPVSKEPKSESKNIVFNSRVYCTNCGKRLKSSWAHCPQCGQKN